MTVAIELMTVAVEKKTCRCCGYVRAIAELARLAVRLGRKDAEYAPGFSAQFIYTEIDLGIRRLEMELVCECEEA